MTAPTFVRLPAIDFAHVTQGLRDRNASCGVAVTDGDSAHVAHASVAAGPGVAAAEAIDTMAACVSIAAQVALFYPWNQTSTSNQIDAFESFVAALASSPYFEQLFSECWQVTRNGTDPRSVRDAIVRFAEQAVQPLFDPGSFDPSGSAAVTYPNAVGDSPALTIDQALTNVINGAGVAPGSTSLCITSLFYVDPNAPSGRQYTVTLVYAYLTLSQDAHCGKTMRDEDLVLGCAKLGFLPERVTSAPPGFASQFAHLYGSLHSPLADDGDPLIQNIQWLEGAGRFTPVASPFRWFLIEQNSGASAVAMAHTLGANIPLLQFYYDGSLQLHFGMAVSPEASPNDADDFGRCYRFIKAFPEFEDKLQWPVYAPPWDKIFKDWALLASLYEQGRNDELDSFLRMYPFVAN